jgi:hypothetical protein
MAKVRTKPVPYKCHPNCSPDCKGHLMVLEIDDSIDTVVLEIDGVAKHVMDKNLLRKVLQSKIK